MSFEPLKSNETLVKIVEGKWRSTEGGLQGSYGNCQGWTHMGLCLKAYLEYGINLRKGSFYQQESNLTSVFVDDRDQALKFYTRIFGSVKKSDFSSKQIIHLKTCLPTLVSSFHVDD